MAGKQGAQKKTTETQGAASEDTCRVVCSVNTIGNAVMVGERARSFASVVINGATLLISERMTPEEAERLERIECYRRWDGDEAEHGRVIEDALDQARRAQHSAAGTSYDAESYKQQLREQQKINRVLGGELDAAKERITELEAANAKLSESSNTEVSAELERLRAENRGLAEENAKLMEAATKPAA